MATVTLAYLFEPRIKGRVYTYYRRHGSRTALSRRDTPGFLPSLPRGAHAGRGNIAHGRSAPPGVLPGSMASLVAAYRASPKWRELAPGSREDYDKCLNPLAERYGKLAVAAMPRQFVFKLQAEYSTMPAFTRHDPSRPILDAEGHQIILQTPRRANGMVNVLRLLLAWAVNQGGWVKTNVAERPGRLKTGPGHRMWTEADVAALMASAEEPIRRGAMLGLCTGQRKGDCLAMLRTARGGGMLNVVQAKTKAELQLPEHPDLTHILDAAPVTPALTLLTRDDGAPWKEDHFNAAFAKAGLVGLKFHGLRKTASGILAEAGATDAEIDSILGHVDPKMTLLYRRQANQRTLGKAAMGKLAGRRIGQIDKLEISK